MEAIPSVHKVKSNPEKQTAAIPMKKINWEIIARRELLTREKDCPKKIGANVQDNNVVGYRKEC